MPTKNTTELVKGDVVLKYGMRVLLDQEPKISKGRGYQGLDVYGFAGTVTNLEEVLAEGFVPASFLYTWKWEDGKGWVPDRRDVWVVQGNRLATWVTES